MELIFIPNDTLTNSEDIIKHLKCEFAIIKNIDELPLIVHVSTEPSSICLFKKKDYLILRLR
jgi:hypothetical protein